MSSNQKQQQQVKGIRIKRTSFERVFADRHGFTLAFGKPAEGGQLNRVGSRHHCTLQLVGPADDLVSAGLILHLPFLDQIALTRARQYLDTFFEQIPEATAGASWVWANLVEAAGKSNGVETFHLGLRVSLNCLTANDGVVATITITGA